MKCQGKMEHSQNLLTFEINSVVRWYFENVYETYEGPGILHFYCDPEKVGAFAVAPEDLAAGDSNGLFRIFITLSMFQGLRDVVIMSHQRKLKLAEVNILSSLKKIKTAAARSRCPTLRTGTVFDAECDVGKIGVSVDCSNYPGQGCHVKDATIAFNRMGDMGKLPTSAWLHIWDARGIDAILKEVFRNGESPYKNAEILVERLSCVYRVGRKLSTLFVSALSTPELAPGLTPWFPSVNGNELVVVDTNVARAIDLLCGKDLPKSYSAREKWVRTQARKINMKQFYPSAPEYSPRLLQQALYSFCSKSNRVARGDACAVSPGRCAECAPLLCPFADGSSAQENGIQRSEKTPSSLLGMRC